MRRYVVGSVGMGMLIALAIWWLANDSTASDNATTAEAQTSSLTTTQRRVWSDGGIVVAPNVKCEATVRGVVTDLIGGGPIDRVEISYFEDQVATVLAVTHESGAYELCVPTGYVSLQFSSEGFANRTDEVYAEATTAHDVTLSPEAIVAGRVIDAETKRPVAEADVTVDVTRGISVNVEGKTDASGRFEIHRLPSGRATVYAKKHGDWGTTISGAARSGERTELERPIEIKNSRRTVELVSHPAIVTGKVTRNGAPIAHARVTAGSNSAISGDDGTYKIANIAPGNYDLYAEVTGVAFTKNHPVELKPDEHRTYDLELELAGVITGVVTDQNDVPVAGARIRFSRAGDHDFSIAATHRDGSFRATGLEGGGSYYVNVTDGDGEVLRSVTGNRFPNVSVADGASTVDAGKLRVQLDHQTIAGIVLDEAGNGLADIAVTAAGAGRRKVVTTTTASGAFTFSGLQQHTYSVAALAPTGAVEQRVDTGTTNLVLRVQPPGAIAVHLEGYVKLEVTLMSGIQDLKQLVERDWIFRGLPPGDYTVFHDDPRVWEHVHVTSGETAAITVRRPATGAVVARVTFHGRSASDDTSCTLAVTNNVSPVNGLVHFDSIPVGSNRIVCASDDKVIDQTFEVSANQTTTLELAFADPVHHDAGIELETQFDDIVVSAVTPDAPAARANVHVGDIVVACNGLPARWLDSVTSGLAKNATNRLTIERDNLKFDVTITSP